MGMITPYWRKILGCASAAVWLALHPPARAQEPARILATGVFASTLHSLAEPFEAATGSKLHISIANAGQVAARVAAGEPVDLVMTSSASLRTLAKNGFVAARETGIGTMRLGVAVAEGGKADLSSPEAFRRLLLSADRLAYIDPAGGGSSGPHFTKMLASLGIVEAVGAKALLYRTGAEVVGAVAAGTASVGLTQASEILGVKGVAFAGFIPEPLNLTTAYAASIATHAKNPEPARAFLEFVTGPTGSARLRDAGWTIER